MYSLGIILFELLWPFNTDMHRYKDISQLKNYGVFPEGMQNNFPKEVSTRQLLALILTVR